VGLLENIALMNRASHSGVGRPDHTALPGSSTASLFLIIRVFDPRDVAGPPDDGLTRDTATGSGRWWDQIRDRPDGLFVRLPVRWFQRGPSQLPWRRRGCADISLNVEQIILQLYLGYELINRPLKDSSSIASGPRLIVSSYGGLRYTSFDIEMDLRLCAAIGPLSANEFFESDQSEDWFDPVIGLDVTFADLGSLTIGGRADIGGFGVGSDFVWSVSARASFELTPNISIFGGYHLLDYDYSDGSGSGKFALDGQLRGPILGVQIRF
jgi:hypothetical protein